MANTKYSVNKDWSEDEQEEKSEADTESEGTLSVESHVVRINDLRDEAADSRGMHYGFYMEDGQVAGVYGGHYFDTKEGRVTSQWDPMRITWDNVPQDVKDLLLDQIGANDLSEIAPEPSDN